MHALGIVASLAVVFVGSVNIYAISLAYSLPMPWYASTGIFCGILWITVGAVGALVCIRTDLD